MPDDECTRCKGSGVVLIAKRVVRCTCPAGRVLAESAQRAEEIRLRAYVAGRARA